MSSPELHVSGGAGGTEANLVDLGVLADASESMGAELGDIAAACHSMLVDADVLASAVLDPTGAAAFEGGLLQALDGPRGLSALALRVGGRGWAIRTVISNYELADQVQADLLSRIDWWQGRTGALLAQAAAAGISAGLSGDWEEWLTEHPGAIDDFLDSVPGFLGTQDPLQSVAGSLGRLWPDGRPVVTAQGVDTLDPSMINPPADLGDVYAGLAYRNGQSNATEDQIDVRVITQPDGSRSYIVDIPGTKAWGKPWEENLSPNDLATNVRVLGGDTTTRQRAIAGALAMAGATADDPVMLVGHSQGGMVAAQAAADSASGAFDYNVTHVLTAGSPIGLADIPDDVQVLALENGNDVVPHLDSTDNPGSPNVTTVTFDNQEGSIGENHAMESGYGDAIDALDGLDDPSVAAYRASAGQFLSAPGDGTTVEAQQYELDRAT